MMLLSHKPLIIFLAMAFSMPLAWAEPAQETTVATGDSEEQLPDAMQHLIVAPEFDIASIRDPFQSYLSTLNTRRPVLSEVRMDRNRPREPLENYDLSTLKLVAIFTMGETRVAMIEDSTGKGYTVRQGSYMGKNNGRIEKIDDHTLYLVEQGLNPAGELIDNQVTLTLKEVNDSF